MTQTNYQSDGSNPPKINLRFRTLYILCASILLALTITFFCIIVPYVLEANKVEGAIALNTVSMVIDYEMLQNGTISDEGLALLKPLEDNLIIINQSDGSKVFSANADFAVPAVSDQQGSVNYKGNIIFYDTQNEYISYYQITALQNSSFGTILSIGIIYLIVIGLVILAMQRYLVLPIFKLERILRGAVKNELDFEIDNIKHSHFLSTIFSNLQLVIDKMKTLILKESNAQLMKKQAELDALQSQINPHFLYNTLDTIRGQAHTAGLKNVEAMTLALSKLFRYSISNHNSFVTLEEELDMIENYFLIQSLRFGDKFSKIYRVDYDTLQHKVPKMLIQPLVENAILHGLEPKLGQGTLIISAYKTETRLIINISDDGIGIKQDRLVEINNMLDKKDQSIIKKKTGASIGLYNINSRIHLLLGSECQVSVFSTENIGTDVQISIPLM